MLLRNLQNYLLLEGDVNEIFLKFLLLTISISSEFNNSSLNTMYIILLARLLCKLLHTAGRSRYYSHSNRTVYLPHSYVPFSNLFFLLPNSQFWLTVDVCMYLSIYLFIYLSICIHIYISINLSIYLSSYLYIHFYIYQSIYLSIYLFIYLPTYLPIYLSIYLSI